MSFLNISRAQKRNWALVVIISAVYPILFSLVITYFFMFHAEKFYSALYFPFFNFKDVDLSFSIEYGSAAILLFCIALLPPIILAWRSLRMTLPVAITTTLLYICCMGYYIYTISFWLAFGIAHGFLGDGHWTR
jgi:hypothetical protein